MRMTMFGAAALLTVAAAPAAAWDDLAAMEMATSLGAVLAGGEKCGYTYDNRAVIAFVQGTS